jgi:hypothetical protein
VNKTILLFVWKYKAKSPMKYADNTAIYYGIGQTIDHKTTRKPRVAQTKISQIRTYPVDKANPVP